MHLVQKDADPRIVIGGFAAILAILAADLLSKRAWFPNADDISAFSFFDGAIRNIRHLNTGLLADLPVPQPVIWIVSLLIIALAAYGLWLAATRRRLWEGLALGILLGGAFGNLFDRVTLGYVRDWILVGGRSALNVADISILLGLICWYAAQRPLERQKKD